MPDKQKQSYVNVLELLSQRFPGGSQSYNRIINELIEVFPESVFKGCYYHITKTKDIVFKTKCNADSSAFVPLFLYCPLILSLGVEGWFYIQMDVLSLGQGQRLSIFFQYFKKTCLLKGEFQNTWCVPIPRKA